MGGREGAEETGRLAEEEPFDEVSVRFQIQVTALLFPSFWRQEIAVEGFAGTAAEFENRSSDGGLPIALASQAIFQRICRANSGLDENLPPRLPLLVIEVDTRTRWGRNIHCSGSDKSAHSHVTAPAGEQISAPPFDD